MTRPSLAVLVVRSLKAHGFDWPGGETNARIVRSRAGHWQRSQGAMSWWLLAPENPSDAYLVGGYVSATVCVRRGYVPAWDHNGFAVIFDPGAA